MLGMMNRHRPPKRLLSCTVALTAFVALRAQTLVSATGGSMQSGGVVFEYSLGEIGIETLRSAANAHTQGLLQPVAKPEGCDFVRLVPNAFTPNSDNKNDCFRVLNWPDVNRFELTVFNRWGQSVFHTTNIKDCWTGWANGKTEAPGTYVYLITAETIKCGIVHTSGTVILIR